MVKMSENTNRRKKPLKQQNLIDEPCYVITVKHEVCKRCCFFALLFFYCWPLKGFAFNENVCPVHKPTHAQ